MYKLYEIYNARIITNFFQKKKNYKYQKQNHVHETWKIPKDFKDDVLYSLDNSLKEPRIQLENATDILKVFRMNQKPFTPGVHIRGTDEKL